MLGYESAEVRGRSVADITHPEDIEATRAALGRLLRGDSRAFVIEKRYLRKDGRALWAQSTVSLTRDEQGHPGHIIAMTEDITERRRWREVQEEARASLETSLQLRDEFLSIASHELKTPLTSMKLQTQLLKRQLSQGDPSPRAPGRLEGFVEQTDRQVRRLSRLVDDMLDIGRIRSGKLTLHREQLDLAELARETMERMQPQFAAAGASLPRLEAGEKVPGCWDRIRIEQVLTNLMTNALRYGKCREVLIRVWREAGSARLSVRDQGIGIAPEMIERIFGRFERGVDASDVSGLGLGLYISSQIVLAHGGRIWVESELGSGSMFHVELPGREGNV